MNELLKKLNYEIEKLNQSRMFNTNNYLESLIHQTGQLRFFYKDLCEKEQIEPEQMLYHLPMKIYEGDIVYVNLETGFPKELRDGHWCYILKKTKAKAFIIPLTSLKDDKPSDKWEMDLPVIYKEIKTKSRFNFGEMRWIDLQRVYYKKGKMKALIDRKYIFDIFIQFLTTDDYELSSHHHINQMQGVETVIKIPIRDIHKQKSKSTKHKFYQSHKCG